MIRKILANVYRLYLAFLKSDKDARENYRLEDEKHRKENNGMPMGAW